MPSLSISLIEVGTNKYLYLLHLQVKRLYSLPDGNKSYSEQRLGDESDCWENFAPSDL